jgi:hypothetical protein
MYTIRTEERRDRQQRRTVISGQPELLYHVCFGFLGMACPVVRPRFMGAMGPGNGGRGAYDWRLQGIYAGSIEEFFGDGGTFQRKAGLEISEFREMYI